MGHWFAVVNAYGALLVAPLACSASQLTYMRAGRRYDLGAIQFVALGAFGLAALTTSGVGHASRDVALALGIPAFAAVVLRVLTLSKASASIFTLVSVAQFWSTPALIASAQVDAHEWSGIQVGSLAPPMMVVLAGGVLTTGIMFLMVRGGWTARLEAATESPAAYDVLFGSRTKLAMQLEATAVLQYVLAGCLLRLVSDSLSVERFHGEALWITIGAALAPAARPRWVVAAPCLVAILRYFMSAHFSAALNGILAQVTLAVSLGVVIWHSMRAQRVRRG